MKTAVFLQVRLDSSRLPEKALKIIGISILIIFFLLLAIPFAFQSQIKDMVKRFINENVNAQVEFSDVSLSLIRSFPQAHVQVENLVITNFKPFIWKIK